MANLTTLGGTDCAVCESGPAERRIDLGSHSLFYCASCGSWSSDAEFREASVSFEPEAYFGNAEGDREHWESLLARREASGGRLDAVLDVGCGNGAFLAFVKGRSSQITRVGIELDAGRASEARRRDPESTIFEGDAQAALDATDGRFDLITLWDVLEHVRAPGRLLTSLAGKLAPGGWIYAQTIHANSIVPVIGRLAYHLSAGRLVGMARRTHEAHHLCFFSRAALPALATNAGLEIRDLWWGRLARERMDGPGWLTAATATTLWLENKMGQGLFVNLLLEPKAESPATGGSSRRNDRGPGRADDSQGR